jgi:prepilin-type N-terminal cleavage/methylation domain-containing protein
MHSFFQRRSPHREAGVTLVELIIAMLIMALLVTITIYGLGAYRRRSEDVVCMGNLRGLHAAFSAYLNDNNQVWPQDPKFQDDADFSETEDSDESKFWYETLKPYGPNRSTWLCPADRHSTAVDTDPDIYDTSYTVTQFDEERGGFHGDGEINEVMPDASIRKAPY